MALLFVHFCNLTQAQVGDCSIKNLAFQPGESVTYKVSYNWGFLWLNAGEATFSVSAGTFANKPCYDLKCTGSTYQDYDMFYKARERYECYIDTESLRPFRYIRDTEEGGYKVYNDNFFNFEKNKVFTIKSGTGIGEKNGYDTTDISRCTHDILSLLYYSRCIDVSKLKVNDTVPISIFLDSKTYSLQYRYLGKEKIKTEFGKVNCIKFSPMLVVGNIFSEGHQMLVWITDDVNKIPVLIETPIVVGSVKAVLKDYSGLRGVIGK